MFGAKVRENVFSANVGENVFGNFGENVFGDYVGENVFGDFGEMWSAQLWRLRIGVRYKVAWSSATASGC